MSADERNKLSEVAGDPSIKGVGRLPEPSLVFRNLVLKSRSRQKTVFVGELDPTIDPSQLNPKSAFEHNLVTQLDVQETVFDHIFQKLCSESPSITNPIVLTEALCCPQKCRAQVTQLLLETYSVEKIAYFVDGLSSYYSNFCSASDRTDTLLVSFGYHNTHVMAFSGPQFHPLGLIPPACRRLGVGGAHVAWYLQQLLALKYQCHADRLTTTVAEQLVRTFGRVAENYREEMNKWTNESYWTTNTKKWSLDHSDHSTKKANEAAERRQLQAERLRELHRRRHLEKMNLKKEEEEQDEEEEESVASRKQRRPVTSKRVHARDDEDEEGEETESASLSPTSSADEDEEREAEIERNVSVAHSVAKVSLEQASLNKAKENCLLLRQKKATELLASFALPAAVQAQITSATTTSAVGLNEEKMRRRTMAAADLEARRGEDYLLWLSDLRHKRQHLAKQRSSRQSRIDFATELGLNAPPAVELTGNGALKTENTESAATVVSLERKTSRVEEGSLNERRQRQLEKIRAMAAELKPERGRGSRKSLNTGDRGRGARAARAPARKISRKDSGRSIVDSVSAENTMDGTGSPSLLEEGADSLDQLGNEDSKITLLDDDFESVDCLDELEPRALSSHTDALNLPVSPSSLLPFSNGNNACSNSGARARDAFDRLEDLSDLSECERDQLAVLDSVRALYDPEFVKDAGTTGLKVDIAEYYTLNIGTEPIRATEALFERSLIGSPQAGVGECLSWILRDSSVALYKDGSHTAWVPKRLFITGGLAHLPGMKERLQVELQQLLPWKEDGTDLEVVVAADPSLDAWHGARKWSLNAVETGVGFTTRSQYDECGLEYLVENEISNRFYGNTRDLELNPKFTSGRGRQPSMIS
ncbi:Actin-related protein 5 [Sparganum proliferum]